MEEVRITKAISWRNLWLKENAPSRTVKVRQSADPQLTRVAGVCLAAVSRWAGEMIKDDSRSDVQVVKQMVVTANHYRALLGLSKYSSIFGPKLREIQSAANISMDRVEAFRRSNIEVAKATKSKSMKHAVIEFARTMVNEGKAIFLLSFKTKGGRHIIGLHGNSKDRRVGFFDPNVGIYRYSNLTTFASTLTDLLLDYYSTPSDVLLRKVETKK